MAEVIDLNEYKAAKSLREEKKRNKSQSGNTGGGFIGYPGKLGEAMNKFGSHSGKKNKDRFKDKIELGEENE